MAVAYSRAQARLGHGAMMVRDPVVTMVSLPRFLAPGDNARIGVVDQQSRRRRRRLPADACRRAARALSRRRSTAPIPLAAGENFTDGFPLSATTIGNVALKLELTGPGDLRIARDFTIGVRPAQSYQLRRFVGRLEPGQSVTLDDGAADEFLPGTAEALLTVSPRPDWDVPGLLRALDRYAYGCLEQTTSRALPLLYVEAVAGLWRTDPGFTPAETVDRAIGHVVELQRSRRQLRRVERHRRHGAVARRLCHRFPDPRQGARQERAGFRDQGGARLAARLCPAGAQRDRGSAGGRLCALRAGAGQGRRSAGAALFQRYADGASCRPSSPRRSSARRWRNTAMRRAPTAAYDAALGAAATAAGRAALCRLRQRSARQRRRARLCRRQSAATQPRLTAVMDRIAELFARADRTSTQEQAWLLMAAEAAARDERRHDDGRDRRAPRRRPAASRSICAAQLGSGAAPVTIANRGADAGMAHGVDHRRAEGRSAGREQAATPCQPRGLPAATARRPI